MKKLIGLAGSYTCYYIGNIFCIISYKRLNSRLKAAIGYWSAKQYQVFMSYSYKIQKWAKLDRPWRNTI